VVVVIVVVLLERLAARPTAKYPHKITAVTPRSDPFVLGGGRTRRNYTVRPGMLSAVFQEKVVARADARC